MARTTSETSPNPSAVQHPQTDELSAWRHADVVRAVFAAAARAASGDEARHVRAVTEHIRIAEVVVDEVDPKLDAAIGVGMQADSGVDHDDPNARSDETAEVRAVSALPQLVGAGGLRRDCHRAHDDVVAGQGADVRIAGHGAHLGGISGDDRAHVHALEHAHAIGRSDPIDLGLWPLNDDVDRRRRRIGETIGETAGKMRALSKRRCRRKDQRSQTDNEGWRDPTATKQFVELESRSSSRFG